MLDTMIDTNRTSKVSESLAGAPISRVALLRYQAIDRLKAELVTAGGKDALDFVVEARERTGYPMLELLDAALTFSRVGRTMCADGLERWVELSREVSRQRGVADAVTQMFLLADAWMSTRLDLGALSLTLAREHGRDPFSKPHRHQWGKTITILDDLRPRVKDVKNGGIEAMAIIFECGISAASVANMLRLNFKTRTRRPRNDRVGLGGGR